MSGWDHTEWTQVFLDHYNTHKQPYNDSGPGLPFGVEITQVPPTVRGMVYRIIGVHKLTGSNPDENTMNHHIYMDVIDSEGIRLNGTTLIINRNNMGASGARIDKPANEPGTNYPHYGEGIIGINVVADNPSDSVCCFRQDYPHEVSDPPGVQMGHHSWFVVWQLMPNETQPPIDPPDPEPGKIYTVRVHVRTIATTTIIDKDSGDVVLETSVETEKTEDTDWGSAPHHLETGDEL